jgi:prophage regulatory protein
MNANKMCRPAQVCELIKVSKSTLQRLVQSGELQQPVRLSKRCVAWPESAIADFIASRAKVGG